MNEPDNTATKTLEPGVINHIVFDVGRVILHWDPELAYLGIIDDAGERQHFLTEICGQAWNREQDLGRSWHDAETELIAVHPDKADLIRAYRARWHLMVPHPLPDTVAIMEDLLSTGHDLTLLTNFSQDTFPEAQERFPILTKTRGATVSGDLGLLKPERAIYEHHVEAFDLDPSATLFFDDTMDNVEGARAAGWQAEHFTSPDQLVVDLTRYGIIR